MSGGGGRRKGKGKREQGGMERGSREIEKRKGKG